MQKPQHATLYAIEILNCIRRSYFLLAKIPQESYHHTPSLQLTLSELPRLCAKFWLRLIILSLSSQF